MGNSVHKSLRHTKLHDDHNNVKLYDVISHLCPYGSDCKFEDSELDLVSCRLIISRCVKHGGIKGHSLLKLWY